MQKIRIKLHDFCIVKLRKLWWKLNVFYNCFPSHSIPFHAIIFYAVIWKWSWIFLKITDSLPGLNFAFHCGGGVTPEHPNLLRCQNIEEGIKKCNENNKKVLLSVGGSTMYANLGNVENAKRHAQHLWDLFLGGNGTPQLRPFGT